MHQAHARVRFFMGTLREKELDWRDKESDRGEQSEASGSFAYRLGVQEGAFLMQNVLV